MKYQINEMKEQIRNNLSQKRYEHTLGVEYTACALAMRYGADMEKARLAGLLHDCAKCFSDEALMEKCIAHSIPLNEFEKKAPALLHAKVGAYMASHQFGIDDEEILSAITCHTTGRPEMTLLDKIIYIADYIEPNRKQVPDLPEIRTLAFQDLDQCLSVILEHILNYLKTQNSVIDPMTSATYEYYRR